METKNHDFASDLRTALATGSDSDFVMVASLAGLAASGMAQTDILAGNVSTDFPREIRAEIATRLAARKVTSPASLNRDCSVGDVVLRLGAPADGTLEDWRAVAKSAGRKAVKSALREGTILSWQDFYDMGQETVKRPANRAVLSIKPDGSILEHDALAGLSDDALLAALTVLSDAVEGRGL
jgi:hypothetical protein